MRHIRTLVVAVLLAGSAYGMVRGAMPAVQSGTWAPVTPMTDARAGAASALLPSGAVLVTGGSSETGSTASVELFAPDGAFSPVAPMNNARADHAAVVLDDGRVLVVGGRGSDGALAASEIYLAGSWMPAPSLADARWGHSATVMKDGRVLVVGGENALGNVASIEVFDPATSVWSIAGTLAATRRGHATAALADGRVLVAGGFDGSQALSSMEVFDPQDGSISSLSVSLSAPRAGLSATRLLDNKILFFGGTDGSTDLASGEVFDPIAGSMTATPSAAVGRRDHQAFLLPNNNAVLIVGGVTAAGVSASAELYLPWLNQFWATGTMGVARQDATGSALSSESYGPPSTSDGLLMVAGGEGLSTSEAYGFATVKTDLDDYVPGMTVHVSGSGWQPNETVTLGLRELPAEHESRTFSFQADENGRIPASDLFVVEPHHFGVRFYLTARGAASQAQVTFTDARQFTAAISPATAIQNVATTYTLTVTNTSTLTGDDPLACVEVAIPSGVGTITGLSVIATDPPIPPGTLRTWSVGVVSGSIQAVQNGAAADNINVDGTVQITFTATATTAGVKQFTTTGSRNTNCSQGGGNAFTIVSAQPSVTVAPPPGTLTVIKHVINNNGGAKVASDFNLTVTGTNVQPSATFAGAESPGTTVTLSAGSYSVDEAAVSGYTKSLSSDCTGVIASGQTKTCTITNDDQAATLTVIKHVVNDNGGTKAASDFSMTVTGTNVQPNATFAGAESPGTTVTLNAGSYSVDEATVAGYTKTIGLNCSGTIANGETKSCTITNDDQPGTLTVIKHVVNDNGGTKVAGDFSLTVTGTNVQPSATFSGAESPGTTVTLNAGNYSVDEAAVTGYTKTIGLNCSGTIANGETKSCTITNDDQPGTLTVIKHVVNDNGGTKVAGDFSLTVTGTNVQPNATFPGAESPGTTVTLNAGGYSVDEAAVTGYTKTIGLNCSGTIANGETKSCTITNDDQPGTLTVIKHVINDDGGTKVAGDFSLTVSGTNVQPNATFPGAESPGTTVTLNAGSYSVDEAAVSGYTKTLGPNCSGTIANGETKSCTITNDDLPGTLTVIKHVINDNGGTKVAVDFSLTVSGTNVQPNATFPGAESPGTTVTLNAGSYSVNEAAVSGYTKTLGADCSGTIANGETKSCTITNDDQPGTLTVIKHVINDNGGTKVATDFSLTVTGTNIQPSATFPGAESPGTTVTLNAGSFSVDEALVSGYTKTIGADCSGAIANGETKSCTITNDDQPGTLIVIKHVINNDGGAKDAGDFSLTVTGANVLPSATFTGAESPGTTVTLDAGSYSVDEAAVTGYTKLLGADCSGSIANGETKSCTVTNDDQPGTLIVIKHVINDSGGTKVAGDFSLTVSGTNVLPSATFPGAESPGTTVTLSAGSYSVDEALVFGYTKTLAADCAGVIGNGETKTCTVTNDDQPGTLIVIKHVINNDGGAKVAADFSLTVSGTNVQPDATFPGAESPGTTVTLNAGNYSVDEAAVSGYTKTIGANCSGMIANGETKSCTITNDDQPGTLVVIKHVVNDNGGTKAAGDFSLTVTGINVQPNATFPGAESPGTTVTLNAGNYSVDEAVVNGYAKTLGAACSGVIGNGETRTCTIVNDDIQPKLIVIKHVINDHGGTSLPGNFTMSVTGTNVAPASFAGADTPGTTVGLDAGAYTVTESVLFGYAQSSSIDCSGTIAIGETKTCTVTNDDIQPKLMVIKTVINDNGGTAVASNFTMSVSGIEVSLPSFPGAPGPGGTLVGLDAGSYTVGETAVFGYAPSATADCAGSINIGETKTCTITNNDIQPQLIVIKHVVNNNGGVSVASSFTMSVTGNNVSPASFPGAESPGTTVALNAGSFSVGETGPPLYIRSDSGECSGTIGIGQVKTCTVTNNDLYDFRGFFSPVENLPKVNKVNAGRAIPLKWELRDHLGNFVLNLDAVDSIQYVRVGCSVGEVIAPMPLDADDSGTSGLRITDNQFHFNWKTEKSFANTCMELRVTLDDSTVHVAKFNFTK